MTSASASGAAGSAKSQAPMRVRRVLVPLDGSAFSRQILPLLRGFFAVGDVELVLLRVAAIQEAGSSGAIDQAMLVQELEQDAATLRELGFAVTMQVASGEPTQCIIDAASKGAVDVVAMATIGGACEHAAADAENSIDERVLRSVSVPVLLMRPERGCGEAGGG